MSAIPVLQDELNRKTFEALEWLFVALDHAKITPHQFGTGIDAVFRATAGLVNADNMQLMTEADGSAPRALPVERRVFVRGDNVTRLMRRVGGDTVEITIFHHGVPNKTRTIELDTPAQARDRVVAAAATLLANGFEEL